MKIKLVTALTAFAVSLSAFAQAAPSPAPNQAPHESRVRHASDERQISRNDLREFRHNREVGPEAVVQPGMPGGQEARAPGQGVEGAHHGFARESGAQAKRERFEQRKKRHEMRDARADKREELRRTREERHEKRAERRERRHQAEHTVTPSASGPKPQQLLSYN